MAWRLVGSARQIRRVLPCALALALLVFGPGPAASAPLASAQAAAETWVGRIEGTDAFIAVVTDRQNVVAYICDGRQLAEWFRGTLPDGRGVLSADSGLRLTLDVREGPPVGILEMLDAGIVPISTELASGAAGLYRAEGVAEGLAVVGGWIVLNNNDARGNFRVGGGVADTPVEIAPGGIVGVTPDGGVTVSDVGELRTARRSYTPTFPDAAPVAGTVIPTRVTIAA